MHRWTFDCVREEGIDCQTMIHCLVVWEVDHRIERHLYENYGRKEYGKKRISRDELPE